MTDTPGRRGAGFMAAATLIFRIAVAIAVFVAIGDLIDRALHTSPWFLLVGILSGVALVIVDLERKASSDRRRRKGDTRDRGG